MEPPLPDGCSQHYLRGPQVTGVRTLAGSGRPHARARRVLAFTPSTTCRVWRAKSASAVGCERGNLRLGGWHRLFVLLGGSWLFIVATLSWIAVGEVALVDSFRIHERMHVPSVDSLAPDDSADVIRASVDGIPSTIGFRPGTSPD